MIYESNWGPVYYSLSGPPDGLVVVFTHGANWHKRTPGSQRVVIPQAGHLANQDNPTAFNQALLAFLETAAR